MLKQTILCVELYVISLTGQKIKCLYYLYAFIEVLAYECAALAEYKQ